LTSEEKHKMNYPTAHDYQKNIISINDNTGTDFGKRGKRKDLHQNKNDSPGPGTYSN